VGVPRLGCPRGRQLRRHGPAPRRRRGRRSGHGVVGGARTRLVAGGPATGRAHRQLLARMENRTGPRDQPWDLRRDRRGPGALDRGNVCRPGTPAASDSRRARIHRDGGAVGTICRRIVPTSAAVRLLRRPARRDCRCLAGSFLRSERVAGISRLRRRGTVGAGDGPVALSGAGLLSWAARA